MLSGVRIYTSDSVWHQIFTDFGATVMDAPITGCINFDEITPNSVISVLELKSLLLNATDTGSVLRLVFGGDVSLPKIQAQIVAFLHKSGGMTIAELKNALGYAPDVATHSIDNAIYLLRKTYGRSFIKNTNGVYRLGEL